MEIIYRTYEERVAKSKADREYKKRVNSAMYKLGLRMRPLQIDHIVPISFCKAIGLTPEECCNPHNLQLITELHNLDKGAFVKYEDVLELLEVVCREDITITKEMTKDWNLYQLNNRGLLDYMRNQVIKRLNNKTLCSK